MASPAGRFSGFKGSVRHVGPLLGEHTDSVLQGLLEYSPEQVEALRKKGVVSERPIAPTGNSKANLAEQDI